MHPQHENPLRDTICLDHAYLKLQLLEYAAYAPRKHWQNVGQFSELTPVVVKYTRQFPALKMSLHSVSAAGQAARKLQSPAASVTEGRVMTCASTGKHGHCLLNFNASDLKRMLQIVMSALLVLSDWSHGPVRHARHALNPLDNLLP